MPSEIVGTPVLSSIDEAARKSQQAESQRPRRKPVTKRQREAARAFDARERT